MKTAIYAESNMISNVPYIETLKAVADYIFKAVTPSYGPGAKDQMLLTKDSFVITKDGKEILNALQFDNDLCNAIKRVILDAAKLQGDKKGDSSTTIILFITALINIAYGDFSFKEIADSLNTLFEEIKSEPFDTTNREMIHNLMYSITRDERITEMCTDIFHNINDNPVVMIDKDALSNKTRVIKEDDPSIDSKVLYAPTIMSFESFEFQNAKIAVFNNSLDMDNDDLLDFWLATNETPVILFVDNLSPTCRDTIKRLESRIRKNSFGTLAETALQLKSTQRIMQPFIIMTYTGAMTANTEFKRAFSTVLYDDDNIMSANGSLFDRFMYECIMSNGLAIQTLKYFEDIKLYEDSRDIGPNTRLHFNNILKGSFSVNFKEHKFTIRHLFYGPNAVTLRDKLQLDMNSNNFADQTNAKNIYTGLFGTFIKILVGSDLVLEKSNDYELIKDAVYTGKNAMTYGVFKGSLIDEMKHRLQEKDPKNNNWSEYLIYLTLDRLIGYRDCNIKTVSNVQVYDSYDSVKTAIFNGAKTAETLMSLANVYVTNNNSIINNAISVEID